jgi:Flp pilus assembly secretin CpaC
VTSEDQQNAVRLNGGFVPGISSRGFRTTIEIDSGKTFVMEGVKTTRDFYWLVSVEVLPEPKGE